MTHSTRYMPLLLLLVMAGCGSLSSSSGSSPASLVPNKTLQLTPSFGIQLEKIVFWGAYAGAAYLILDPLAPNWEIEEAPLPDNHIHLALKMKRFYAGGAGEARVVFQRRARELVQYGEFAAYEVMEYNEGLESSMLGSQRVAEGVIRLTGQAKPDQGSAAPARSIPESAINPLS